MIFRQRTLPLAGALAALTILLALEAFRSGYQVGNDLARRDAHKEAH